MITLPKNQLMTMFNDPTFAWQLLQWEIAIDMNESLSGQAIAKLLELYMRGVEKMNSLMDIRQSYFKNKVTSLMMRGNVVKTLNKPPMAKKEKPLEATAKIEVKPETIKAIVPKKKKQVEPQPTVRPAQPAVNTFSLQEKKKEIQMRLAYQADESSHQNITKMYNQLISKEEKFNSKVNNLMNDHEERLKERINRRKLKTATYRSRPEDTNDTSRQQMDFPGRIEEAFASNHNINDKAQKKASRRFQSLQNKVKHDLTFEESPKKVRKFTFDITPHSKEQNKAMPPIQLFKKQLKAREE